MAECDSYVEWLVWELLATVTRSRHASYNTHSGIRGKRTLPSLYPRIERLGEGVYWHPSPWMCTSTATPLQGSGSSRRLAERPAGVPMA